MNKRENERRNTVYRLHRFFRFSIFSISSSSSTIILIILVFNCIDALAQSDVPIINPSFEGVPGLHENPKFLKGWYDCSKFPDKSPPEVHSADTDLYAVSHDALNGKTFVSLVVREDGTWECIGKELEQQLLQGRKYTFEIFASQSNTYQSPSSSGSKQITDYTRPVLLRIWGGSAKYDFALLLGQSGPVDHEDWREYEFTFEPKTDVAYLMIEAYYFQEGEAYAGHVLIDNARLLEYE